jgi:hypothetical protein
VVCKKPFVTTHGGKKCCSKACVAERHRRPVRVPPLAVPSVPRMCLGPKCQGRKPFKSTGIGHRMCGECRVVVDQRTRTHSPMAFGVGADVPVELQ